MSYIILPPFDLSSLLPVSNFILFGEEKNVSKVAKNVLTNETERPRPPKTMSSKCYQWNLCPIEHGGPRYLPPCVQYLKIMVGVLQETVSVHLFLYADARCQCKKCECVRAVPPNSRFFIHVRGDIHFNCRLKRRLSPLVKRSMAWPHFQITQSAKFCAFVWAKTINLGWYLP